MRFITLPGASGTVANLFIHGYSAGHDIADRISLARSIPTSLEGCVNLFGYWESGHIARLERHSKVALGLAMRVNLYAAAGALVLDRGAHFLRMRKRATEEGHRLLRQLKQYLRAHHPEVSRVNLVGHSLGARLIISALLKLEEDPGFELGDILLMAAAASLDEAQARGIAGRLQGRLINAFSPHDKTLLLNADERSLGRRRRFPCRNVLMRGFDHTHYWPRLSEVLWKSDFQGLRQGQAEPVPVSDKVEADPLLLVVLQRSDASLRAELARHLANSAWVGKVSDDAYDLARELRLLGGNVLANLARKSGCPYVEILASLAEHFGLLDQLEDCRQTLELETQLVAHAFRALLSPGHPLADPQTLAVHLGALEPVALFAEAERLAQAMSLSAALKSPSGSTELVEAGALKAWRRRIGERLTRLGSAVRPGYSALVPAVVLVCYARLRLGDHRLY